MIIITRVLLFSFCIGLSIYAKAHSFEMAYYDILESGKGYHLKISYDRDDIRKEITTKYPHILEMSEATAAQELEHCLIDYVEKHVSFQFDNQEVKFIEWSFEYEQTLTQISIKLKTKSKKVKNITVINTCLIQNKKHNNIIRSYLYDRDRHFRLTKDRQKTTIAYK